MRLTIEEEQRLAAIERKLENNLLKCLNSVVVGEQKAIEEVQTFFRTAKNDNIFASNQQDQKKAVIEYLDLKAKAADDNPYYLYLLGLIYQNGWGGIQSNPEAYVYFKRAAEQNYVEAQVAVGILLESAEVKNYSESASFYRQAAEYGHPIALYRLGLLYELGRGLPMIYPEAIRLYLQSAKRGCGWAYYRLGLMHETGYGVKQDLKTAGKYFWLAAQKNIPDAQFKISLFFESGQIFSKNIEEAIRWQHAAAMQNHVEAQYKLYFYYLAKNDYRQALSWLYSAANLNHPAAQHTLGMLLQNGQGMPINYVEANRWFEKSANQGYVLSQYSLAYNYETGRGTGINTREAMRLYNAAVAQDNGDAMYRLGCMYERNRDMHSACYWYLRCVGRVSYRDEVVTELRKKWWSSDEMKRIQADAKARVKADLLARNNYRLQTQQYDAVLKDAQVVKEVANRYVDANGPVNGGLIGLAFAEMTKGPSDLVYEYERLARQGLAETQKRKEDRTKGEIEALNGNYQKAREYFNWVLQSEPNPNIRRYLQQNINYLTGLIEAPQKPLDEATQESLDEFGNFQWGGPKAQFKPPIFLSTASKKFFEIELPQKLSSLEFKYKYLASECELFSLPPETQKEDLIKLMQFNEAYVYIGEKLFYVNKNNNEWTPIALTEEDSAQLNSMIQKPIHSKVLSYQELRFITSITMHTITGYRVEDEINNLKNLARLYIKHNNYYMAIQLIHVAIALYEKINDYNIVGNEAISQMEFPVDSQAAIVPYIDKWFNTPTNDPVCQELMDIRVGIEQAFIINWCNTENLNLSSIQNFRPYLAASRKQLLKKALSRANSVTDELHSKHALQLFTEFYSELLKKEIENCHAAIKKPAQEFEYAFVSLGSMARREMLVFSDIEIFILISKDNKEIRDFIYQLAQLLMFKIVCWGETHTPKWGNLVNNRIYGDNFKHFSVPLVRVHCDKFCESNFPLLVQTPEKLAQYQLNKLVMKHQPTAAQVAGVLADSLITFAYLTGSEHSKALLEEYEHAYKQVMSSAYQSTGLTIRQKIALEMIKKIPLIQRIDKFTHGKLSLDVKEYFYITLRYLIGALVLFYELKNLNFWDQIDELHALGIINLEVSAAVKKAMNLIYGLRIQAHLVYGEAKETICLVKTPANKEKQFIVAKEKLQSILQVLLPLDEAVRKFADSKGKKNLFLTLNFSDLLARAKVALYSGDADEAQHCCRGLLLSEPHNIDALSLLAETLVAKKQYPEALENYKAVLKHLNEASLQSGDAGLSANDETKSKTIIKTLHRLIKVYRKQDNIDEALVEMNKYAKYYQEERIVNHLLVIEISYLRIKLLIQQNNLLVVLKEFSLVEGIIDKVEPDEDKQIVRARYADLVAEAFNTINDGIYKHYEAVLEKLGSGREQEKIDMLLNLSRSLSTTGKFKQAKQFIIQARSLQQQFFAQSNEVALAVDSISAFYFLKKDNLPQALLYGMRLESILKILTVDNISNRQFLLSHIILAELYLYVRNYDAALNNAEKAKKIIEVSRVKDNMLLMKNLYLLGCIFRQSNDFDKARESFLQAIALVQNNIMSDDLSTLAKTYYELFTLPATTAAAIPPQSYLERLTKLILQYEKLEYPAVVDLLLTAAQMANELNDSFNLLQKALNLAKNVYGAESKKVHRIHYLLGKLQLQDNKIKEASDYFFTAINYFEKNDEKRRTVNFAQGIPEITEHSFELARIGYHKKEQQRIFKQFNKILLSLDTNLATDVALPFALLSKLINLRSCLSNDLNKYLERMRRICEIDTNYLEKFAESLRKLAQEQPLENHANALHYFWEAHDIIQRQLSSYTQNETPSIDTHQSARQEKKSALQKELLALYYCLLKAQITKIQLTLAANPQDFEKQFPLQLIQDYAKLAIIKIAQLANEIYPKDSLDFAELLEIIMKSPFININIKFEAPEVASLQANNEAPGKDKSAIPIQSNITLATESNQNAVGKNPNRDYSAPDQIPVHSHLAVIIAEAIRYQFFIVTGINDANMFDGLFIDVQENDREKYKLAFQHMPTYDVCIQCGIKALEIKTARYGETAFQLKSIHKYLAALFDKKVKLGDLNAQHNLNFHLSKLQAIENNLKASVIPAAVAINTMNSAQANPSSNNATLSRTDGPFNTAADAPVQNRKTTVTTNAPGQQNNQLLDPDTQQLLRDASASARYWTNSLASSFSSSLQKSIEAKKPVLLWASPSQSSIFQRLHEYFVRNGRESNSSYLEKKEDFIQLLTKLRKSCTPETVSEHIRQSKGFRQLSAIGNSEYCDLRDELTKLNKQDLEQEMLNYSEYLKKYIEKKAKPSEEIESLFASLIYNLLQGREHHSAGQQMK